MQPNSSIPFRPETIRGVLESPEGKQLLQLLGRDGGKALQQAADALRRGDTAAAQAAVAPLMQTPEAAKLTSKLNQAERSRHGGV